MKRETAKFCLVIAGPTASGKSWLAEEIARKCDAQIINADSMQVYASFPILTAQPQLSESCALYGYKNPDQSYSVAEWLKDAREAIEQAFAAYKLPIVVGGTGLYINALIHGLAEIPTISMENREKARNLMQELGPQAFAEMLFKLDPKARDRLKISDRQRLTRAFEVWLETGKSIFDWQEQVHEDSTCQFLVIKLLPPKKELDQRIAARFDLMLKEGALEEAALAQTINLSDSATKIIGLREIGLYLSGELSLENAREKSIIASRQYAKRQLTWFRNKLDAHISIPHIPDQTDVEGVLSLMHL